ncbi:MAG: carboxylesterase family protein, partial [Deltaproteobacteria bacterium]|nr:carboxylesterase family protein [Deltaproteobacteria bacterium]
APLIFREGEQSDVDLLIGWTANEKLMWLPDPVTQADLDTALDTYVLDEDRAEVLSLLEEAGGEGLAGRLDRLLSAAEQYCPSLAMARAMRSRSDRVFVYRFTRVRPGAEQLGAFHTAEIPYVFDTADTWLPRGERDQWLTKRMLRYWVQFARNGDPNGEGLPIWPVFDAEREDHQVLGDDIRPAQGLDRELCRFLDRWRDERAEGAAGVASAEAQKRPSNSSVKTVSCSREPAELRSPGPELFTEID